MAAMAATAVRRRRAASRRAKPATVPEPRHRRPSSARTGAAPRKDRRALHQRPAARRPGNHRPDRQGTAGTEGRAHHFAHRAARPLPGLHAHRRPHRRLAQDSLRRRAPAPEARSCKPTAPAFPAASSCRTAGEGRTEEELRADMHFLYNLWLDMRQKAEKRPAPAADPSRSRSWWSASCATSSPPRSKASGWITKKSTKACCASCSASSPRWSAASSSTPAPTPSSTSSASPPSSKRRCGPRSG